MLDNSTLKEMLGKKYLTPSARRNAVDLAVTVRLIQGARSDLFTVLAAMGDKPKDIRDRALLLVGFGRTSPEFYSRGVLQPPVNF